MLFLLTLLVAFIDGSSSSLMSVHPHYSRPLSGISPSDTRHFGKGMLISGHNFLVSPKFKWPKGVVHWQYDPASTFTTNEKNIIESAMTKISEIACIYFVPRTNESAYVNFRNNDTGCWTFLGYYNDSQDINMDANCFDDNSIALHMLLHTLGMEHEHSRYDRDLFLEVLWENIEPGVEINFKKVPRTYAYPRFDFDFTSLMMYTTTAFGVQGRPSMMILVEVDGVDKYDVGRANKMSQSDEWRLHTAYRCDYNMETLPPQEQFKKTFLNFF